MIVGAGADGIIDLLSQATLDPGDEIVCGWPSFPSYVLDAAKLGAEARRGAAARPHVRPRRRCSPRSGRGRSSSTSATRTTRPARRTARDELARVPRPAAGARPLSCSTRRTSSTSTTRTTPTGSSCFREGRRVVVLRTFSKIYGLAGLRVGWAVAPADVVDGDEQGAARVRRDGDGAGGGAREPRRRAGDRAAAGAERDRPRRGSAEILREHGLEPAGPALGNFLFADVGGGRALFEQLQREGVIVRPLDGFGAPEAIRVTRRARRRRTSSSRSRWDTSFRASRNQPCIGGTFGRKLVRLLFRPARAAPAAGVPATSSSRRSARASGRCSPPSRSRSTSRTRTNSGPLGRRASSSSSSCRRSSSGSLLGPLLDRLERRSLMIARRRRPGRRVRGAAVRAERGDGRRARARRRSRDRLLPAGGLRRRPEPRPRRGAAAARTRCSRRSRTSSWAVGPLLGGVLTAAAGPSAAYAINAVSFVVSIVLVVRIPPRLLQSERALSRGHWRDLAGRLQRRAPLAARCVAVLVAWGIASLGIGAANVARSSSRSTRSRAGDFGYGLLYGAIGAGLVLGSFFSAPVLARFGVARTYGGEPRADGGRATSASAREPEHLGRGRAAASSPASGTASAVACNALLVQRGTFDLMRGRALTFVMSTTYVARRRRRRRRRRVRSVDSADVPRWIWAACGAGARASPRVAGLGCSRASSAARPPPRPRCAPRPRLSQPRTRVRAVAGRRDWTREDLAAGVRAGRPARARARDLARRGRRSARVRRRRRPLSRDRLRVLGRRHRPARRREVEPRLGADPARPRARDVDRRRRLGRSLEPVHARRAARRPDPAQRPLPRPRRLHPLDGDARPSRRSRRGGAAGAARARRGRQGRRLPRDGRRGAERGRGDRDRRHRPPRPHARLGRRGAGVEGGDHGDPGRDRDQQDGHPAAKTMLNEVRSILALDQRAASGTRRSS